MLIQDLMTKDRLIYAPEKTTLQQAEDILHEYRIEKLPVVDKNGKLIGLITYKDITKVKNYPFSSKDDAGECAWLLQLASRLMLMQRIEALNMLALILFVLIRRIAGHSQGVLTLSKMQNKRFQI